MVLRACACGSQFDTTNLNRRKCKPECGRARSRASKDGARDRARELHELEFIGVDGEGINVWQDVWEVDQDSGEQFPLMEEGEDGEIVPVRERVHRYVLLSVGDKSLHRDGRPLTHDDIFTFLWEQFLANPNAVFVGFFLGYDFTNWLKSLPAHAARSLLTKEGIERRRPKGDGNKFDLWPVRDGGWRYRDGVRVLSARWEFDLMAGKRLRLRPYVRYEDVPTRIVTHKDGTKEEVKESRPWMYICDTGAFYQSSFLSAINPKDWTVPVVSQEEYDVIEEGKANRDVAELNDDMIRYNVLENEVLARLMTRLNEGFVADGIRLSKKQWFGPGQAAQAWMRNIGIPTGEEIREVVPRWARDAARKTYYGGWFEIFNHGPVPGTSYAYDINSAYPAVIATLPCLLHGKWTKGTGKPGRLPTGALRMVYATVAGNDDWVGAMPHRQPDGSILRPRNTKGWYWWSEVKAAQRARIISRITIHESVTYEPCKCDPPAAQIRELYEGRLQSGKNTSAGKSKKLVYNSSYGKWAQSVGNPKFANPIYASLITSGCRTMILDAIATHPTKTASLLMVATDGIVFKEPHPNLDIHETRLGAWDAEEYQNLSLFMPGLYWDDKTRQLIEEKKSPKLKSRGVAAKDLAKVINRVDRAWGEMERGDPCPAINLEIEWSMVTAKLAIVRGKWSTCGRIIYGGERKLDGKPDAKRDPHFTLAWGGYRSMPYERANEEETTYYDRAFGEEPEERDDVGEMVTPDGKIGSLMAWALRR